MKTSLFDMNFILPPMVEMTEVVKDTPKASHTVCNEDIGYC